MTAGYLVTCFVVVGTMGIRGWWLSNPFYLTKYAN